MKIKKFPKKKIFLGTSLFNFLFWRDITNSKNISLSSSVDQFRNYPKNVTLEEELLCINNLIYNKTIRKLSLKTSKKGINTNLYAQLLDTNQKSNKLVIQSQSFNHQKFEIIKNDFPILPVSEILNPVKPGNFFPYKKAFMQYWVWPFVGLAGYFYLKRPLIFLNKISQSSSTDFSNKNSISNTNILNNLDQSYSQMHMQKNMHTTESINFVLKSNTNNDTNEKSQKFEFFKDEKLNRFFLKIDELEKKELKNLWQFYFFSKKRQIQNFLHPQKLDKISDSNSLTQIYDNKIATTSYSMLPIPHFSWWNSLLTNHLYQRSRLLINWYLLPSLNDKTKNSYSKFHFENIFNSKNNIINKKNIKNYKWSQSLFLENLENKQFMHLNSGFPVTSYNKASSVMDNQLKKLFLSRIRDSFATFDNLSIFKSLLNSNSKFLDSSSSKEPFFIESGNIHESQQHKDQSNLLQAINSILKTKSKYQTLMVNSSSKLLPVKNRNQTQTVNFSRSRSSSQKSSDFYRLTVNLNVLINNNFKKQFLIQHFSRFLNQYITDSNLNLLFQEKSDQLLNKSNIDLNTEFKFLMNLLQLYKFYNESTIVPLTKIKDKQTILDYYLLYQSQKNLEKIFRLKNNNLKQLFSELNNKSLTYELLILKFLKNKITTTNSSYTRNLNSIFSQSCSHEILPTFYSGEKKINNFVIDDLNFLNNSNISSIKTKRNLLEFLFKTSDLSNVSAISKSINQYKYFNHPQTKNPADKSSAVFTNLYTSQPYKILKLEQPIKMNFNQQNFTRTKNIETIFDDKQYESFLKFKNLLSKKIKIRNHELNLGITQNSQNFSNHQNEKKQISKGQFTEKVKLAFYLTQDSSLFSPFLDNFKASSNVSKSFSLKSSNEKNRVLYNTADSKYSISTRIMMNKFTDMNTKISKDLEKKYSEVLFKSIEKLQKFRSIISDFLFKILLLIKQNQIFLLDQHNIIIEQSLYSDWILSPKLYRDKISNVSAIKRNNSFQMYPLYKEKYLLKDKKKFQNSAKFLVNKSIENHKQEKIFRTYLSYQFHNKKQKKIKFSENQIKKFALTHFFNPTISEENNYKANVTLINSSRSKYLQKTLKNLKHYLIKKQKKLSEQLNIESQKNVVHNISNLSRDSIQNFLSKNNPNDLYFSPNTLLRRIGFLFFYQSEQLNLDTINRLDKEKSLQKKRRRKKRKRLYPRPVWSRFLFYKNFLINRYFSFKKELKFENRIINSNSPTKFYKDLAMDNWLSANTNFPKQAFFIKFKNKKKLIVKLENKNVYSQRQIMSNCANVNHKPINIVKKDNEHLKNSTTLRNMTNKKNQNKKFVCTNSKLKQPWKNLKFSTKLYRNNKQQWGYKFQNNLNIEKSLFKKTRLSIPRNLRSHKYYSISNNIMSEFQRLCWKSYWLRSSLTPYIRRVQDSLKKMRQVETKFLYTNSNVLNKLNNFFVFRNVDSISFKNLNGSLSENINTKIFSESNNIQKKLFPLFWYVNMKSALQPNFSTSSSLIFNRFSERAEYDRILYERISDVIQNVKANLNTNSYSQLHSYSSYSQDVLLHQMDDLNNVGQSKDSNFFVDKGYSLRQLHPKSFKRGRRKQEKVLHQGFWSRFALNLNRTLNLSQIHAFSLGSVADSSIKPYGDLPTLRSLWALNQTNTLSKSIEPPNQNFANETKTLWATLKVRDQSISNKTNKFYYTFWNKLFPKNLNKISLKKLQIANKKICYAGFGLQNKKINLHHLKLNFKSKFLNNRFKNKNTPKNMDSNHSKGLKDVDYSYSQLHSYSQLRALHEKPLNLLETSEAQKHSKRNIHFWWSTKSFHSDWLFSEFVFTAPPDIFSWSKARYNSNPKLVNAENSSIQYNLNQTKTFSNVELPNISISAVKLLWGCTLLLHICTLFSLIQIAEIRSFMKFFILLLYKFSNSYLIIVYSIFTLMKNYLKQLSLIFKSIRPASAYSEIINTQFKKIEANKYIVDTKNKSREKFLLKESKNSYSKYRKKDSESAISRMHTLRNAQMHNYKVIYSKNKNSFIFRFFDKKNTNNNITDPEYFEGIGPKTTIFDKKMSKTIESDEHNSKFSKFFPEIISNNPTIQAKIYFNKVNNSGYNSGYIGMNILPIFQNTEKNKNLYMLDYKKDFSILEMCFYLPNLKSSQSSDITITTKNTNIFQNQRQKILIQLNDSINQLVSSPKNLQNFAYSFIYILKNKSNKISRDSSYSKKNDNIEFAKFFQNRLAKIQNLFWLFLLSTTKASISLMYECTSISSFIIFKIIDFFESLMLVIYKFLEKPAEFMIDWIAQFFLVEWSSELTSFIPESFDIYTWQSFTKLYRGSRIFGLFGFLIQRRLWCFFEIFVNECIKPDSDLLTRQKKGLIFWDIWAEILMIAAEKYKINLSSLITLKEEQEAFLERLLDDPKFVCTDSTFKHAWFSSWSGSNVSSLFISNSLTNPYSVNKKSIKPKNAEILDKNNLEKNQYNFSFINTKFNNKKFNKSISSIEEKQARTLNDLARLATMTERPISFEKEVFSSKSIITTRNSLNFYIKNKDLNFSQHIDKNFRNIWRRWSANQYFSHQGIDTDLFIDVHPPKSFCQLNILKPVHYLYNYKYQIKADNESFLQPFKNHSDLRSRKAINIGSLSAPAISGPGLHTLGLLTCQIYSGLFSKEVSKNILVVGASGNRQNLLIYALAGETELKMITDNAHRYAHIQRGVAVGMKLLRDVFDGLALHTPCLFLMEDIHVIGERRPMLISDHENAKAVETTFATENEEVHEKNQLIYQLNKHIISDFKKPYKGDFSLLLPTNHFCFDLFLGVSAPKIRKINLSPRSPFSLESQFYEQKTSGSLKSQNKKSNLIFTSQLQLPSQQFFAPPATSPFTILGMKEQSKFKATKIVKELPWGGISSDQMMLIPKVMYSIRVKIAFLADMAMNQLGVKLDMITDLLVIMDNVRSNRGFVVFATTHLPFVLDPALRRPGRFDETISLSILHNFVNRIEILKTQLCNYSSTFEFFDYSFLIQHLNETSLENLISRTKLLLFNTSNQNLLLSLNNEQSSLKTYKNTNFSKNSTFIADTFDLISENKEYLHTKGLLTSRQYMLTPNSISSINKGMKFLTQIEIIEPEKIYKKRKKLLSRINHEELLFTNLLKTDQLISSQAKSILAVTYSQVGTFMIQSQILFDNRCFRFVYSSESSNFLNTNFESNLAKGPEGIFNNLYSPSLDLQNHLMHLISGKIGEFFVFNNSKISGNFASFIKPSSLLLKSLSKIRIHNNIKTSKSEQFNTISLKSAITSPGLESGSWNFSIARQSQYFSSGSELTKNNISGDKSSNSLDSFWSSATSFVFSFVQKRYLFHKNLLAMKLLYFHDNSILREPPSPPGSSILMPARKYENLKRTERDFQQKSVYSILEKIQIHQQQRSMKNLYEQPVFELFRSEMVKNRYTRFNSSVKELGYYDSKIRKTTSVNCYYKNRILTRQQFSLVNQWWSGQLAEHNLEKTFSSDVDWRSMFVEFFGDLVIDFPDADQYYNPKLRRWFLQSTYGGYWQTFEKTIPYEIYYHFMILCFNKAFNYLNTEREILDDFAYTYLQKGFLKEIDFISNLSKFSTINRLKN